MDKFKLSILKQRAKQDKISLIVSIIATIIMFMITVYAIVNKDNDVIKILLILTCMLDIINVRNSKKRYFESQKELDEELKNINKNNKNE